jgi:RNA polymerase sigma-70 factor (ECF subfamily)
MIAAASPVPAELDRELARRAQAGDLAAFDELVRHYERPLFNYLYRLCGNGSLAEELAQEAFVRAWQKLAGFQARASFKTWLLRIATNLSINRLTRTRPTAELSETMAGPSRDQPDEVARVKQRRQSVQQALSELPADQRSCLILATYEEMSYAEIARALGKSVRAVDSLLFRGRRNLRRRLEPARAKGLL